ncbi:STAS domain-containing protein [Niveispirillum sp. KHB5.9]|uniref:STAS domain-containing protein n=1 Tax=Niveispirillum sp. KHB5.9 TaxID=3400269 RepID=UPI003A84A410
MFSEIIHGELVIIELTGRIDSNNYLEIEGFLVERAGRASGRLLIDFQQVGYISSAGLRTLLKCAKLSKAAQGRLVLSSMNENVFQIFELSGFTKLFQFAQSRASGVDLLS